MVRPLSLDDFFEERRIQSCVSCPVPSPEDDDLSDDEPENPAEPQPLRRAITTGAQKFMTSVAAVTGFWTAPECTAKAQEDNGFWAAPEGTGFWTTQAAAAVPPVNFSAAEAMPRILMLSEALPEPDLGSPGLPTIGSAGHNIRTCKPCAFFHTRGCGNGVECSFCHLCAPDEKRRRQKGKVAMLREMRQHERRQVRL